MKSHARILKFLFSGGSAAAVEYLLFTIIMHFQFLPLVGAQSISFLTGLLVSYSLNRRWVFKSNNKIKKESLRYLILALANLFLTNVVLILFVDILEMKYLLAKILVMACVAIWNYFIFQKIIFASSEK